MEGEEETIDEDRYSLLNANYVLKIRRHQGSNPRPVGDVHFVPKGSANIDEAEDERTNGAMKIVSFHDVHRDRVRCSDQLLYRSMIFLREAYWVTTSDRELLPYGRSPLRHSPRVSSILTLSTLLTLLKL